MHPASPTKVIAGPAVRAESLRGRSVLWTALLLLTALIWGFQFIAIKYAVQFVSPLEVITLRFVPAAIIFAVWLLPAHGRQVWHMLRAERWRFLLLGLTGAIINNSLLALGLQHVPAGTASLIISLNPVFTYALSMLVLQERFRRGRALGMALAFAGVFIILRWGGGREIRMDHVGYALLIIVAPVSWAVYTVLSKSVTRRHPPLLVTGTSMMVAGLVSLAFVRPSLVAQLPQLTPAFWGAVLFMAVPSTIFAFVVWVGALRWMPAGRVASFVYWIPLFAVLFGHWLLSEPVTAALLLGAAILLAGVWLVNRRQGNGERI